MTTNEQVLQRLDDGFKKNDKDHGAIQTFLTTHEIRLTTQEKDLEALQKATVACEADRATIWKKLRFLLDANLTSRGYKAGVLAVFGIVVTIASILGGFIVKALGGG